MWKWCWSWQLTVCHGSGVTKNVESESGCLSHVKAEVHGACCRNGGECKHNAPCVVVLSRVGELDLLQVEGLVFRGSGGPLVGVRWDSVVDVSDVVGVVSVGVGSLEDGSHDGGDDSSNEVSNAFDNQIEGTFSGAMNWRCMMSDGESLVRRVTHPALRRLILCRRHGRWLTSTRTWWSLIMGSHHRFRHRVRISRSKVFRPLREECIRKSSTEWSLWRSWWQETGHRRICDQAHRQDNQTEPDRTRHRIRRPLKSLRCSWLVVFLGWQYSVCSMGYPGSKFCRWCSSTERCWRDHRHLWKTPSQRSANSVRVIIVRVIAVSILSWDSMVSIAIFYLQRSSWYGRTRRTSGPASPEPHVP